MTDAVSLTRRDFGLNSIRLGRRWRNAVNSELAAFGLTAATWRPLFYLGALGDGVRPKDLAEALDMERPSLGQLLDRLERQGYVLRRGATDDRRSKTLHLTDEGRRVYERTIETSVTVGERLTQGISEQELAQCLRVFERIEANADSGPLI